MNIIVNVKNQFGFFRSGLKLQKVNWIFSLSYKVIPATIVLSLAIILWQIRTLPPQIPIWYSQAWGTNRLANHTWLFLFPLSAFIWYLIDILIAVYVTHEHYVFSQILYVTAMFVAVFSLIALINIIFLVG
jgi:hypothetical protein